jgi:hypothetical protein
LGVLNALLVSLAVIASGCGGSSSPGVANVATTTTEPSPTQSAMAQALKLAACMRSHGVPTFPDPTAVSGGGVHFDVLPAMVASPAYATAFRSCSAYEPTPTPPSAAQLAPLVQHLRTLARCMRHHGVPNFPDPTSDGAFRLQGLGIDKRSPTVRVALAGCLTAAGLPSSAASALAASPP